jgi:hypothetical protein
MLIAGRAGSPFGAFIEKISARDELDAFLVNGILFFPKPTNKSLHDEFANIDLQRAARTTNRHVSRDRID